MVPEASTARALVKAPAHFVGSSSKKPQLVQWKWGSEGVSARCAQAEKMLSVDVHPTGAYVAAGGVSGRVYLWRAGDGALVRVTRAHLKPVSAVAFAAAGVRLLTGSEDCTVRAWSGVSLLDADAEVDASYRPKPVHTWRGHTLPVTSLSRCWGASEDSPVASTSLDRTVRLLRPVSGAVLAVIALPAPLYCCATDLKGLRLVAGAGDGSAFVVPLRPEAAAVTVHADREAAEALMEPEEGVFATGAVAAAAASASSSSPAEAEAGHDAAGSSVAAPARQRTSHATLDPECAGMSIGDAVVLAGHRACVHDVVLTSDCASAVTASEDGTVRVWDLASGQQTGTLPGLSGAATCLQLLPRSCLLRSGSRLDPLAPLAHLSKHSVPLSQRREAREATGGIDTSAVPVARTLIPAVGGGVRAPCVGLLGADGREDTWLLEYAAAAREEAERPPPTRAAAVMAAAEALRGGDAASALRACGLVEAAELVDAKGRGSSSSSGLGFDMGDDGEAAPTVTSSDRSKRSRAAAPVVATAAAALAAAEAAEPSAKEAELAARVAELEGETARWQSVNAKLLERLRKSGAQL